MDSAGRPISVGDQVCYPSRSRNYNNSIMVARVAEVAEDHIVVERIHGSGCGPVLRDIRQAIGSIHITLMRPLEARPLDAQHPRGQAGKDGRYHRGVPAQVVKHWKRLVYEEGWTHYRVAQKYKVHESTVSRKIRGIARKKAQGEEGEDGKGR